MTPERFKRITSVLDKRQPDLTVIADEVHKQRNLAAIVRNCDAVGIDEIHSVVPAAGFQTYMGTSASAEKWVQIHYHSRVEDPITSLKQRGFQIIAANLSANAVDYRTVDYTRPTALLLGAEVKGVSPTSAGMSDIEVVLPMFGMVESYNVSVACALILAVAQSQRQQAGFYDRVRLPDAHYRKRFFHWAHPVLAEFCDRKGIPYPAVRQDGEVENLSQWYLSASRSCDRES